jgi:hypothetical protein
MCKFTTKPSLRPTVLLNSRIIPTTGIKSLQAVLKAMYSASIVDNAISDCKFDRHTTGHPKARITYPVLLLAQ